MRPGEHGEIRVGEGAHAPIRFETPSMRRIGEAVDSAPFTPPTLAPQTSMGRDAPASREPPRTEWFAAAFLNCYLFSFDCPMISAALKLMLQVGKELPTKKLSPSLE